MSHNLSDSQVSLFYSTKNLHLLLLFEACVKGNVLFCTLNAQFTVLQKYYLLLRGHSNSQQICKINAIIFSLLYQFGERQLCQNICRGIFT